MAMLLCIDSSTTHASVALARNGKMLGMRSNKVQQDHAAFLQPAIAELIQELQLEMNQLQAVCVSSGPGSYTGLRVGMATAKGICFALNIPLLTLPTTKIMAIAALQRIGAEETCLIAPMIDARRMEVFTAAYDSKLDCRMEPQPLILDEHSYLSFLEQSVVYFTGNGSGKWQQICRHSNAHFLPDEWSAADMIATAELMFERQQFSSLAYTAPAYGKAFYSPPAKQAK